MRLIQGVVCHGYSWDLLSFFFNDTATTEIYTLSLHDALPISWKYAAEIAAKIELGMTSETSLVSYFQDTLTLMQIGRAHV